MMRCLSPSRIPARCVPTARRPAWHQSADLTAPPGRVDGQRRWCHPGTPPAKWDADLDGEYATPNEGWEYKGVLPYNRRYWAYSKANLIEFARQGRLIHRDGISSMRSNCPAAGAAVDGSAATACQTTGKPSGTGVLRPIAPRSRGRQRVPLRVATTGRWGGRPATPKWVATWARRRSSGCRSTAAASRGASPPCGGAEVDA
jgi:hypothetical protein